MGVQLSQINLMISVTKIMIVPLQLRHNAGVPRRAVTRYTCMLWALDVTGELDYS